MITEQSLQKFIAKTELMFALPLPQVLRVMLGFCQYTICKDFKLSQRILKTKQKFKNLYARQFMYSYEKLNKQERLSFYSLISDYVLKITNGSQEFAVTKITNIQKQVHIRCNTYNVWNRGSVIYDGINHILELKKNKNKNSEKFIINLSLYMVRKSKNKNYQGFVLQACDRRVSNLYRSIGIGFQNKADYLYILGYVTQSINYRWWQKITAMFKGDALAKNCVNSIKNEFFYQKNSITEKDDEEQFYSFEDIQIQQQQLQQDQNESRIQPWNINQKLKQISNTLQWQSLIICEQFILKKNVSHQERLLLEIISSSKNNLEYYQNKFKQMSSKFVDSITQYRGDIKKYKINCKKINNNYLPVSFCMNREQISRDTNSIVIHQFSYKNQQLFYPGSILGQCQTIWKFHEDVNQKKTISVMIEMKIDQYETSQKKLKFSIQYMKGVFERYLEIQSISVNQFKFFNRERIQVDSVTQMIKICNKYQNSRFILEPMDKGLHQKLTSSDSESLINSDWCADQKGSLQYLNQQKIAAQKGVIKSVISQLGRNLLTGKSILNVSLPVQIFSTQSHLDRMLHSLRLAPIIFEQFSQLQKENISEPQLKQILKHSVIFGISTSLLYLSQQKSFNPILGETCQMWIDGCPAYAEQISHHPPISSIYFIGRGYKIYGQFQAKVQLGLNSGKGSNNGQMIIQFDNGIKVINYFAAGEVSGLSYGKRKFTLNGKSHHFIEQNGLYLQVEYSPKYQGAKQDTIKANLYNIDKSEIKQYHKNQKFKAPKTHKLLQSNILNGKWNEQIKSQQKLILNLKNTKISSMHRDSSILPSDSIYRQDILYRYKEDYKKSQKYKSILEEKQRMDKKLRNNCK